MNASQTRPDLSASLAWRRFAWVTGAFSILLALAMLVGHARGRVNDPWRSPRLLDFKEKLRLNPMDEALKQQIRALDLQLRQRYFQHLWRMDSGAYLLLGGVALFIVACALSARGGRPTALPQPRPDADSQAPQAAMASRWSVAASGAVIGLGLLVVGLSFSSAIPKGAAGIEKLLGGDGQAAASAPDAATVEELRRNWPCFRGADSGYSASTNTPMTWNTTNGAGVVWKTAATSSGFGSPIVWGERLFFSGGDAEKRDVTCLDTRSGKELWRQPITVPAGPGPAPEIPDSTGYAAPTMATDGRRVYVIFANGDTAALSFDGKVLWSKAFGPFKNPYGHAISLVTWRDRLILQLDQGEHEDGKSKLLAVEGRTGRTVWEKPRPVGSSWASPIVIEAAGKPQIITLSLPWTIAYSATDGTELWRVENLNGEVTPSPAFAGGLVLVASPSEKLQAIRPDGPDPNTKTNVVWANEDNVPDVTSPACNGELVFAVTTSGLLTCYDLKDGKKLWEHDFETECHASPVIAGNRLFLFSQKGAGIVVQAAREFKELYRTDMPDTFHATPALVQDRVYLRGVTNIWCLGTTAAKPAQ